MDLNDIFTTADYEMCSQYTDSKKKAKIIRHDIDESFMKMKKYLDGQKIRYASHRKTLLVSGIQIDITGEEKEPTNGQIDQSHRLSIKLSTQNFPKSFTLLKSLVLESELCDEWMTMEFSFNENYYCLRDKTEISTVIFESDGVFDYINDNISTYKYKDNFNFWIMDKNKWKSQKSPEYVITIAFKMKDVIADDLIMLINELQRHGIIFKIEKAQNNLE